MKKTLILLLVISVLIDQNYQKDIKNKAFKRQRSRTSQTSHNESSKYNKRERKQLKNGNQLDTQQKGQANKNNKTKKSEKEKEEQDNQGFGERSRWKEMQSIGGRETTSYSSSNKQGKQQSYQRARGWNNQWDKHKDNHWAKEQEVYQAHLKQRSRHTGGHTSHTSQANNKQQIENKDIFNRITINRSRDTSRHSTNTSHKQGQVQGVDRHSRYQSQYYKQDVRGATSSQAQQETYTGYQPKYKWSPWQPW